MRGRLIDLSIGLNRKQRITIEVDRDFREDFDRLSHYFSFLIVISFHIHPP